MYSCHLMTSSAHREPFTIQVDKDVPLTTRDGVTLRSDVYRPAADGRYPVLLGRTCYGKDTWGRWIDPERTAGEGYAVVINDMRGGFGSDGEFYPFFHDEADGYDVVEWCAAQPWSDGRVGMFGSSAPGFMQLLAAVARPPHLVAIAPMQTWTSFGRGCVYDPGGAFLPYTEQWALLLAAIDPNRRLDAGAPGFADRQERVIQATALGDRWHDRPRANGSAPDFPALPREHSAYFYDWLAHPDHDDYWARLDMSHRYEEIEVPALHLVGLYDGFRLGSTRNYRGLRDRAGSAHARVNQKLVIGPWTHGLPVRAEASAEEPKRDEYVDARALVLRWYDHWLKGDDNGIDREDRVRVYVQGAREWRDEPDWPLPGTIPTAYHLRAGGVLSTEPPAGGETPDGYRHDPDDPVPSFPGRLSRPLAPVDQRPVEDRPDLLVYSTPPLAADVEVTGSIEVRLWASTSATDADWIATLTDVAPDGYSRRLTEGMLRARYRGGQDSPEPVAPGEPVEYTIELRPTSNLFRAGHRIRVHVSSTSFPLYDRTAEAADQVVFHDADRPSAVLLPVIPAR